MEKVAIVLAWVIEDFVVERERRTDLGERPVLKQVDVAKTAMWLRSGTSEDVEKAKKYAEKATDYQIVVMTYPTKERDPLGLAKKAVLMLANKIRKGAR